VNKKKLTIVIIRTSSIGDIVLGSVVLLLLQEFNIIWFGSNPTLGLIRHYYPKVRAVNLTKEFSQVDSILSSVDILFDLQNNFRTRYLCLRYFVLTRKPFYVFAKRSIYRSLLVLKSFLPGIFSKNIIRNEKSWQYLRMLNFVRAKLADNNLLGLNTKKTYRPFFKEQTKDHKIAQSIVPSIFQRKWLAIAAGASYVTKQAPIEVFLKIIYNVLNKIRSFDLGIIFLGDFNDNKDSEKIITGLSKYSIPIENICGKTTLLESSIVLRYASVVLGNDSSICHIAEAVGVPVAVLFGPTVEQFGFVPHLESSRSFSVDLGCRPCSKHGSRSCRFEVRKCFSKINCEQVSNFLVNRLIKQ
jgi:ADP-heptose:LPS heptosyltransferase